MKTFVLFLSLVLLIDSTYSSEIKSPQYSGSETCKSCHQQQYDAWSDSHHSWAWREPKSENVLGNFNNVEFQHAAFNYRFITENGDYYVIADNKSGKAKKYKVNSVVGITPLQQYLVEIGLGHLQALDVAWDTELKRWYHLYPDQDTSAGNGMHWAGSYKNWNSRCAECHATDYRKNYDPLNKSYTSQQTEIGVGCEACHGPGEAHLSWANAPEKFSMGAWMGAKANGLTVVTNSAASEINLCAGCHSRREPVGGNSPFPGSKYTDNYRLSLLRDGLYFPDGQIHDEVYVYGSFLQSKMYEKGVKCSNCHDAHSYRLKAEGNALCTQCHNAQGNALFPSLIKKDYDAADHHFHKVDSEGSECKQCHMLERHYMVVDGRRDHSFRIPRPDLSEKMDLPNVCNTCHQDKSPSWAVAEISKRYPDGQQNKSHFAELFNSADSGISSQTIKQLFDLAKDPNLPAIVRASALERLFPVVGNLDLSEIETLLADDNAWVRSAAVNLFVYSADENKTQKLLPLLSDSVRSVRLEAVKAFLETNPEGLAFSDSLAVKKAMKEYQQSLMDKADFPEIQMVLGGVALTKRNIPAAISAFSQAVEMDSQLIQAWVMLARIQAAVGQTSESKQTLRKAVKANPDNKELQQLSKRSGL
ncbi:MAG: tetratricopeptide repeat protein [Candidatus Thiodiazotropha taylori]|nr:tetratricopeptide repeat protein [Candidatus Thiodiazotropha taylori]MCG7972192.1 tetratricopeptide repeat protein [Candidatus Thiodiazotropha taylori]